MCVRISGVACEERELCVSGNRVGEGGMDGWMDGYSGCETWGEVNQVENDTVVMKLIST